MCAKPSCWGSNTSNNCAITSTPAVARGTIRTPRNKRYRRRWICCLPAPHRPRLGRHRPGNRSSSDSTGFGRAAARRALNNEDGINAASGDVWRFGHVSMRLSDLNAVAGRF